ncbi:Transposon Ty3-I Gag-Pol polyprotein [Senna tora]|uniref:Transposon Ty3-I Gag-Pol polyprotein n=1 Tax=Senna tora TaxID=362788 RepID=A0A834XLM6_9FABA|nr:Transposon Ty3-I Gag-Pol polyprotein [Senna tora]
MASVIAPIASHWISIERRRLIQVIPKAIGKIWDRWDVRAAVLASFVAQSILTIVGNMRKINRQDGDMKILVWMCYLMSDWLVNFALDMISSKLGDYSVDPSIKPEDDPAIMAFWAAFMLVHFGGPHSITAYALEDNALWLRSFFISLLQSGRVLYIILLVWRNTCLSYITIAMLVVGCIKCWEKTWALYSASIDTHRDKLLTPPSQSHHVSVGGDEHAHHPYSATTNPTELIRNFMRFFVSLFTDLVISDEDLLKDQSAFRALEAEQAFKQVGDELGHAYDIFYTKAFVRSQTWGQLFKFITLSITIIVLLFFQIKVITTPTYALSNWDKKITYVLLIGALFIEMVEAIYFIYSKWGAPRLKEIFGEACYYFCSRLLQVVNSEMSSDQFLCTDFLTLCLGRAHLDYSTTGLLHLMQKTADSRIWQVTSNLKFHILNHLKGHRSTKYDFNEEINGKGPASIQWTKELDFHQSILTWHIATDICYHCDNDNNNNSSRLQGNDNIMKKICKNLSDYMLHLLVNQRFMLPIGTGLVACRDTFAEIRRFLILKGLEIPPYKRLMLDIKSYWKQKRNSLTTLGAQPQPQDHDDVESEENDYELCLRQICDKLLEQDRGIVFSIQDGRIVSIIKTKSALSDARKLARSLRHDMESKEVMWEFLANVWVEILGYAAINCRADHHAQQLRRGGEFLSHVWLLMAHLGLMEQFQLKPQNPPHQSHSNHP